MIGKASSVRASERQGRPKANSVNGTGSLRWEQIPHPCAGHTWVATSEILRLGNTVDLWSEMKIHREKRQRALFVLQKSIKL